MQYLDPLRTQLSCSIGYRYLGMFDESVLEDIKLVKTYNGNNANY